MKNFEIILKQEIEKINEEAVLTEVKNTLRHSQGLLREAFDTLQNHGFEKEAWKVMELIEKTGKILRRL